MTKEITNEAGKWRINVLVTSPENIYVDLWRFTEKVQWGGFCSLSDVIYEINRLEKFADEVSKLMEKDREVSDSKKQPIIDKLKELGFE